MSEPVTRRKILEDYRISATKCQTCGKAYFPSKSFCDKEGRASKMQKLDHFYNRGTLYAGNVINIPTNKFKHLGTFLSGVIHFQENDFKVPGRITDYIPPEGDFNISRLIGKAVLPRFRKTYTDGRRGLIYYSSLNFSFEGDYYPFQEYADIKPSQTRERPGIVGYGVYLPKFRVKNEGLGNMGVKERTLPFLDEDATTFAVEAGKRALIHSALNNQYVRKCFVGSESSPYAVKPIMATVSQALELGERQEGGFFSGGIDSQFACKAASDLFIDAAALVAYPTFGGEYVMVIGSDNSQAAPGDPLDFTVGAGGAAFIFGKRDVIATLDCYVPYTSDTPDFYRREGEKYPKHGGRFTGKPAYYKHVLTAMRAVLKKSRLTPKDIDYVVSHSPNRIFPYRASLEAGFNDDQIEPALVVTQIGNLYSASSLTGLAAILDIAETGDKILMVSYGSGAGSEAYIFTATDKITEKRDRSVPVQGQIENPHREYVDYNTYRKWKEIS
jgi:hydroxymethylglutaryl-CoA synthase